MQDYTDTKINFKVPACADTVTLEIEKRKNSISLRDILSKVMAKCRLVIVDEFQKAHYDNAIDLYTLEADNGNQLLEKIERSRVIDSEEILELVPEINISHPKTTLMNGTFATQTESGRVDLWVRIK